MTKREIDEITKGLERKGLTLVPLKLYFSKGWAKLSLGLAKGKKLYDKRQDKAKKDAQREIQRAMKQR
jgi:SsrA-binding protein